jgi:hypothetical protein
MSSFLRKVGGPAVLVMLVGLGAAPAQVERAGYNPYTGYGGQQAAGYNP